MTPMMHYLFNFVATTLAVVAFLYLVYLYIRKNPRIGQVMSGAAQPTGGATQQELWIESALDLEPRKRLYVIRHRNQRFLVSTTMDKTEFLTTLESEPSEGAQPEAVTADISTLSAPATAPVSQDAGFMERFGYSLKMVLGERFTRPGGR